MTEAHKKIIDNMSLEGLLNAWRHAPMTSFYFQGDTGDYFKKVFEQKKKAAGDAAFTSISKKVGWNVPEGVS